MPICANLSARMVDCVVVALPSGPSMTMKLECICSQVYSFSAIIRGYTLINMSDASLSASHTPAGLASHFLRWYWMERPAEIVRLYLRYASAFGSMFSILFLLKTFAAPWKSIKDSYPKNKFSVEAILETLTLNVTARVIGMIVRTGAMCTGLIIQILLFVGFAAYALAWVLFPIFVFAGLFLLISLR
jgi:hypothetical protein